jgi:pyridoxamine 5'-phosphate oxidase
MERTTVERIDYPGEGLAEEQVPAAPYELVGAWLEAAVERGRSGGDVPEPTAMAVATEGSDGIPNVRTVLLRVVEPEGLGFYCHLDSTKGRELAARPVAALTLTWPAMFRAIRARGRVVELDRDTVTAYFTSRPWGSRISAWTSEQSQPVDARDPLQARYAALAARWPDTGSPDDVPVPPRWGGFRIIPEEVEFWAGRSNRLHDRHVFVRTGPGTLADPAAWRRFRRQP